MSRCPRRLERPGPPPAPARRLRPADAPRRGRAGRQFLSPVPLCTGRPDHLRQSPESPPGWWRSWGCGTSGQWANRRPGPCSWCRIQRTAATDGRAGCRAASAGLPGGGTSVGKGGVRLSPRTGPRRLRHGERAHQRTRHSSGIDPQGGPFRRLVATDSLSQPPVSPSLGWALIDSLRIRVVTFKRILMTWLPQ